MTTQSSNRRWVLYEVAAYMTGKGLLFTDDPIYHTKAITDTNWGNVVYGGDFTQYTNSYFDFVFIGDPLGLILSRWDILEEATRKVKVGGHLLLSLPEESSTLECVESVVGECGAWRSKDTTARDGVFTCIFKREVGKSGITRTPPRPEKSVCVSRLGAIGDMIVVTPLLRKLKESGYHVTVSTTPYSVQVLTNNPNVDNVLIQPKDIIPNQELGQYWNYWKERYEKYINLSESIEGTLLKVEGRRDYYTSKDWRHKHCNVNYYDRTLSLGGYPDATGLCGELYISAKERSRAIRLTGGLLNKKNIFTICASLSGTAHHKNYPLFYPTITDFLESHEDARVILVGSGKDEDKAFTHPQVIDLINKTTLREVFAITQLADCVVGPETALTNAAACFETPVIVFLSHSTTENLTKYWKNCIALEPDVALAPCYPCHQLHYTLESCPQAKLINDDNEVVAEGPICTMGAIQGERFIAALESVYDKWKSMI